MIQMPVRMIRLAEFDNGQCTSPLSAITAIQSVYQFHFQNQRLFPGIYCET